MLKNHKLAWAIIGAALFIKLFLFVYMSVYAPQGRILPDSHDYLNNAFMLASRGVFAQVIDGTLQYEFFRTPGYAVFLCLFHYLLKIPLFGIVFLQILLSGACAWIIYRAALEIDPDSALLSGIIVLISPAITTGALLILADTLYVFLLSLFIWLFIRYLKYLKTGLLVLAALFLALATYVRPVTYHFGLLAASFILYANFKRLAWRRAIVHAGIFLLVTYALLLIWQLRNYYHTQHFYFTTIQRDYKTFPNFDAYAKQRFPVGPGQPVFFSYFHEAWHDFLALMARPGTLKYLRSYPIRVACKIFGYPFVVFCWVGFLAGLSKLKASIIYQFIFLAILYFVFLTIAVIAASCGERYQIPIVPLFAMISAAGWIKIKDYLQSKNNRPGKI
jgi:4-amino-4-deoxy-L-arabinose transferase-like glycosyltransferase